MVIYRAKFTNNLTNQKIMFPEINNISDSDEAVELLKFHTHNAQNFTFLNILEFINF